MYIKALCTGINDHSSNVSEPTTYLYITRAYPVRIALKPGNSPAKGSAAVVAPDVGEKNGHFESPLFTFYSLAGTVT